MADKILENLNKNSYDDISGQKNTYVEDVARAQNPNGITEVNPETGLEETREATAADAKLNTGSGAEAAVGTDYTWNKQGTSQAQNKYQSDIIEQKQSLLNNRQTIENNAVNYQTQADMMKYQNNQNAEKVGWTGGYVLDQNRQMDYLKASIQAQMYGAMELQKYGYDSSLAAARLSYDLNQQEYARQYYQEAVSAALSEAQLTGTYFSAETKDMMSQLAVAQQKIDDPNTSDAERERATKLRDQINSWFSSNGISKEGVRTLEAWQQEQAQELEWSKELWTRYQAAMETANAELSENSSMFIMLDENGREIWDGTNVKTGNWETMTGQQIAEYILGNSQATNQYYAYLDATISGEAEAGFTKWCQAHNYITTDEEGNTVIKGNNFAGLFSQFLQSNDIIEKFQKKFENLEMDKAQLDELKQLVYGWDFSIRLPDGTTVNKTYAEIREEINNPQGGKNPDDYESAGATDANGNTLRNYPSSITGTRSDGAYGVYYTNYIGQNKTQIVFTSANADLSKKGANTGGPADADIAINFGNIQGADQKYGYDMEISSDKPSLTSMENEINSWVYAQLGKIPEGGEIITIGGNAYVYLSKGWQGASTAGWYAMDTQCGKSNSFYKDLESNGQMAK